jgi:hypothetical protein
MESGRAGDEMQILVALAGWFLVSVITGLVLGRLLGQFGWER